MHVEDVSYLRELGKILVKFADDHSRKTEEMNVTPSRLTRQAYFRIKWSGETLQSNTLLERLAADPERLSQVLAALTKLWDMSGASLDFRTRSAKVTAR